MKKVILIAGVALMVGACNNNSGNAANTGDPNEVHPVSETIPDSLKLVNDSTLVPDLVPGNGSVGTNDDSARSQHERMKH